MTDEILERMEKAERVGKWVATFILTCALILIIYFLYQVFTIDPDDRPPRVLPAAEKVRFDKLLRFHGLAGKVSVIEIMADGSLWFERGRKRCKLR